MESSIPQKIKDIISLWNIYCGIITNTENENIINYFLYCGWENFENKDENWEKRLKKEGQTLEKHQ